MAIWGPGIYQSDEVMDWIYDLLYYGNLSSIRYALDTINQDQMVITDIPNCQIALAAADLVASLNGDLNQNMPEEAEEWILTMDHSAEELQEQAKDVVRLIYKNSALKDYMQKNNQLDEWTLVINDVLERLD